MTGPDVTWGMPAFAPLYGAGEEQVTLDWLTVEYATSPEIVGGVLPPPLRAPASPAVMLWFARFKDPTFSRADGTSERRPSYTQAGVCVTCEHHGELGAYAVETFIPGLNYGIFGREAFGLPKKQVRQVLVERDGDAVTAGVVMADGAPLLDVAGRVGDPEPGSAVPSWISPHFTLKLVPRADGPGYDISRLVRIPFEVTPLSPASRGEAELTFHPRDSDPVHLLRPVSTPRLSWGSVHLAIRYGTYLEHCDRFPVLGRPSW
ncbi:acetoacetate decarboxylase family protein [Microtetraspora fusca]|uniref:acetoacetate decarboxylase family protein n=1 Tax=Microtetraspora fusca TaxID=1997 RepID=UPI00082CF7EE|nr:acetoacetate decarboxylase family protein [Microtetraspora fusca]